MKNLNEIDLNDLDVGYDIVTRKCDDPNGDENDQGDEDSIVGDRPDDRD